MHGKRKAGRPKKVLVGCSGQEYRRIKERTEQIIFNDDCFNVNLDDLVSQKPPLLNQINQYKEEIDQYEEEMVRDNNSDEEIIKDYEKSDDGYYNDVMINNFEDENFNDDVIEEVNGEGEDEVNKLQFILDKNLKFANKIKSLNEMKFDNLQVLIDAKIIENGKNELKASNANMIVCVGLI